MTNLVLVELVFVARVLVLDVDVEISSNRSRVVGLTSGSGSIIES